MLDRDTEETGTSLTEHQELLLAELGWGVLMSVAIITALLAAGVFISPKPLEFMHSRIAEIIVCLIALFLAWRIVRRYGVEASRHD